MVLEKATTELETLLQFVAEEIQLPPSLDRLARDRYGTLVDALNKTIIGALDVWVYSQGSYRIGTTVKPLTDEDFDLDFVVEVVLPGAIEAQTLLETIWQALKNNGIYKDMVELRPSCVRIHYRDGFHADIVPAIPDEEHGGTAILIPRVHSATDLEWHATNPRAYAHWFLSQGPQARMESAAVKAIVEPLPLPQQAAQKLPIQTAVQLLKRNHAVCVADESARTASIVITTIAAQAAEGCPTLGDALHQSIYSLGKYADAPSPTRVENPAAPYEVISDKWSKRNVFSAFQTSFKLLRTDWEDVLSLQGVDRPQLIEKLQDMFGTGPVARAVNRMSRDIQDARRSDTLSVTKAGTLTASAGAGLLKSRPHTYFGDDA